MQLHLYQSAARRTAKSLVPRSAYDHFVMGIISDWGEIVTAVKAIQVYNKPLDREWDSNRPEKGTTRDYIRAECGDCCWFISYGCDLMGIQFYEIVDYHMSDPAFMAYSHMLDGPDYWARMGAVSAGRLALSAYASGPVDIIKNDLAKFFCCVRQIMREYNLQLEEVLQYNIDKLRKRYPAAYSDEAAQFRADTK